MLSQCVAPGLVAGEGFAVDASTIRADASRCHSTDEQDPDDWHGGNGISRAVGEYAAALSRENRGETPARKLSLTDEGPLFYQRCTLLNGREEAAELSRRSGEASGHLRVSAPVTFGILHMAPLWGEFLQQHPKVSMDVSLSDRTVDLVEDGFDLAIRIAHAPHPAFIVRKLASTKMVFYARLPPV